MPELPSIKYGAEVISREDATARILTRLLSRLPQALWDTDPTSLTVQRELARAIAQQEALLLENRTTLRAMTLLLEAEGVDLDTLLQDYGLKRYLNRPDAYARQVGMHLLWMPKATLHALRILADLLFDLSHVTMRTGRLEAHVFVADTHAVTTPYSYWGLVSEEGLWYAVTVHETLPAIAQLPPPGLNQAPGPHTLHWFTVPDETQVLWYVTIQGDTLTLSPTQPAWGSGTTDPFRVLDGNQGLWELRADRAQQVLVPVAVTGSEPFAYWRVLSPDRGLYVVYVDTEVPTISTTPPAGRDETPTTADLSWFTVLDETAVAWYVTVLADTLQLSRLQPAGLGTAVPFRVLDGAGTWWMLSVDRGEEVLVTTVIAPAATALPVVSPGHTFTACQLRDSLNQAWWLSIKGGTGYLSETLPAGADDITPTGGPFRWLRLYGIDGRLWYGYPLPSGIWALTLTTPGGLGTAVPQRLSDMDGVEWHYGIGAAEVFSLSDAPHVDLQGLATALVINDQDGGRWFIRVSTPGETLETSPVLWPDTIAVAPWGEIGWMRMRNGAGVYQYFHPDRSGVLVVDPGPPFTSWWGWVAPPALRDRTGAYWALNVDDFDNSLTFLPIGADDIPDAGERLVLRDAVDAVAHLHAAGSLVTVLVT